MANMNSQGTFEPLIPHNLFTDDNYKLLDALGVGTYCHNGLVFLYNETYATSGDITNEDGEQVNDGDLYNMLQDTVTDYNSLSSD